MEIKELNELIADQGIGEAQVYVLNEIANAQERIAKVLEDSNALERIAHALEDSTK